MKLFSLKIASAAPTHTFFFLPAAAGPCPVTELTFLERNFYRMWNSFSSSNHSRHLQNFDYGWYSNRNKNWNFSTVLGNFGGSVEILFSSRFDSFRSVLRAFDFFRNFRKSRIYQKSWKNFPTESRKFLRLGKKIRTVSFHLHFCSVRTKRFDRWSKKCRCLVFTANKCEKCPSSIQCWDSNPQL